MKLTVVLVLAAATAFSQNEPKAATPPLPPVMISTAGEMALSKSPVQGAPYTATMVNESVQTLADGNRITQSMSGSTARDSMGRTRQDMPLPALGNLAPANAPHMVMINDPVAQTMYSLNLTDKTAHKMGLPPGLPPPPAPGTATAGFSMLTTTAVSGGITASIAGAAPVMMTAPVQLADRGMQRTFFLSKDDPAETKTESLGSQTMEGVLVQGVRTTRTIPAGEIGNDNPLNIITEVWTSPELKTVVFSKRSDPRTGDQTFRLTNIVRAEPDASLFTIPADFKVADGSQPGQDVIFYRANQ